MEPQVFKLRLVKLEHEICLENAVGFFLRLLSVVSFLPLKVQPGRHQHHFLVTNQQDSLFDVL